MASSNYEQFSYDQVRQVLVQMGFSPKKVSVYIEMFEAIARGIGKPDLHRKAPRGKGSPGCVDF
jgi:hypothetical protein